MYIIKPQIHKTNIYLYGKVSVVAVRAGLYSLYFTPITHFLASWKSVMINERRIEEGLAAKNL
jgi:hypothetical protein